jgi:hypothetical protein
MALAQSKRLLIPEPLTRAFSELKTPDVVNSDAAVMPGARIPGATPEERRKNVSKAVKDATAEVGERHATALAAVRLGVTRQTVEGHLKYKPAKKS